jgi:hypothetical protein
MINNDSKKGLLNGVLVDVVSIVHDNLVVIELNGQRSYSNIFELKSADRIVNLDII